MLQQARFSFIRNAIESPNQASATAFLTRKAAVPDSGNYITLCAMLSHSFSTGSVHIRSSTPRHRPLINFKYLSHPLDAHILGYHMKSLHRLVQTPPLSSLLLANGETLPEGHSIASQVAAEKFVKDCCGTNYHPCGSCAMLPEEMGGVVDEKLKVYGTTNLRIVDASVFPIILRGNIVTMVYAVAEKGADIIGLDLGIRRIS
jgi:choline dehydrogenase-like flavoprotein